VSANPVVLCNSGPLIAVGKLNRLSLLTDLFFEVVIPLPSIKRSSLKVLREALPMHSPSV